MADDFCKMQRHHPQKPSRQIQQSQHQASSRQCAGPGTGCREIDLGCFRALCLSDVENNQGRAQNILVHNHAYLITIVKFHLNLESYASLSLLLAPGGGLNKKPI